MGSYPKTKEERHRLITLSLPPDQLERLDHLVKRSGLPRSRLIQHAVAAYLAAHVSGRETEY